MALVYLNSDKTILCRTMRNGGFFIISDHSNKKNSSRLVKNVESITTVEHQNGNTIISLSGEPYVVIDKKRRVICKHILTSFETRLFAQGKIKVKLPFERFEKKPALLKTDLHSHFAAVLSPAQLIDCGLGNDVTFTSAMLDEIKIDYSYIRPNENNRYRLEDILSSNQNRQLLINAMKIDTSEQETFNKLEEIYAMRAPFTKNPKMFIPMLSAIAEDCKEDGIKYTELSLSNVISDPTLLKEIEEKLPKIEKDTGVKIRFLGAMWRHSDKEWNDDEVDRLKVAAKSPYVVGCDVMGHETNSTMAFYDNIKELAKYAIQNDNNFVIRVHAGENPLFKANARQVLLAVEEAHYELSKEFEKPLGYPQVRIGHGIYGFDEPAPYDENERTKNLTMQQLCEEINPIIEFNMSSNLSLNNINGISEIPIKKYLDSGIRVVLGTDGKGIYSTDIKQEMILARQAGLTNEDFKTIAKTEESVIASANKRFKEHSKNITNYEEEYKTCYASGQPKYNEEISKKRKEEYERLKSELGVKVRSCGAITDYKKIEKTFEGKTPIMLTGSSRKHWPTISKENQAKIKIVLDVLIHCIDTKKAYLMTGGTNHGVEKEAHIIANDFNKHEKGNLLVLGTLTEEAMNTETNSIEANTITHAMIPSLNGRPAKRWFDLPDTVLNMIEEQDGVVVAIGGGAIVRDIIQRAHNMNLNLNTMSGIEGASGEKSISLDGNDYSFSNVKELILKLLNHSKSIIRSGLSMKKLDDMIENAYKKYDPNGKIKRDKDAEVKFEKLNLTSLNKEEYQDIVVECKVVDDIKDYVNKILLDMKLRGQNPKIAKKNSFVRARLGEVGERVDTRPRVERDGKIYVIDETKTAVSVEGSMIVENQDGEQYIVPPDVFKLKYQPTKKQDIYEATSYPIKYIKIDEDIVFKAPWGDYMFALAGAVLNVSNKEDIYAIQAPAFEKTYKKIEEPDIYLG